ncbi:MAG: MarR family transcriptional regulator [Actinomycetota bacterium]|nr:MarR family transcriptional regulator [Actinomycetota bacterium]
MTAAVPSPPLARLFAMAFRQIVDQLHDTLGERGWDDVRPVYGFVLLAARDAPVTPRQIVDLLGFTKQAASQLVDAMAADGYVRKDRDPDDARARLVSITPKGVALLAEVEQIYGEIERGWGDHIGHRRVAAMRSALVDGLAAIYGDEPPPVRPTW